MKEIIFHWMDLLVKYIMEISRKGVSHVKEIPVWITELEEDELTFIKRFVLASGSLKEMADIYGVTYPTVRSRLNHVIEKVKLSEQNKGDPYEKLIKKLTVEGKVDFEAATILIREYRSGKEK